jgi:hypothetical protein
MTDKLNQADIDRVNVARTAIKEVAKTVAEIRHAGFSYGLEGMPSKVDAGEAVANVTLAYRHLEDASMRLGKAIQAVDGGTSVYDRATTVGA